jgi:hypothetical protein
VKYREGPRLRTRGTSLQIMIAVSRPSVGEDELSSIDRLMLGADIKKPARCPTLGS